MVSEIFIVTDECYMLLITQASTKSLDECLMSPLVSVKSKLKGACYHQKGGRSQEEGLVSQLEGTMSQFQGPKSLLQGLKSQL